jgi:hypothetical protein
MACCPSIHGRWGRTLSSGDCVIALSIGCMNDTSIQGGAIIRDEHYFFYIALSIGDCCAPSI